MEKLQSLFSSFKSHEENLSTLSSTFDKAKAALIASPPPPSATSLSTDHSQIILARSSRRVVSLWTCSKLCTFFFVAGIVVGYTLKQRVRRWASRLLRRMKDD